jgi:hypothetical protein
VGSWRQGFEIQLGELVDKLRDRQIDLPRDVSDEVETLLTRALVVLEGAPRTDLS